MGPLRRTAAVVVSTTALVGCALISGAADLSVGPLDGGGGGGSDASAIDLDGASTSDATVSSDGSVGPTDGAVVDAKGDGGDAGGRLREVTFEDGALLGIHGGDSLIGNNALITTGLNALSGMDSMRVDRGSSGIEVDFAPVSELYATALVRLENLSAGLSTIFALVPEAGGSTAEIEVDGANGNSTPLLLAVGGSVMDSGGIVASNTLLRVGFHLRQDASTSLVQVFLAAKGSAFGQPVISTTLPKLGRTIGVRMGILDSSASSNTAKATFDDLLLDELAMPAP